MSSVQDNESYLDEHRARIAAGAPDGCGLVVIDDRVVVGYYSQMTDAMAVWTGHSGAIIETIEPRRPALVASNFRHHPGKF